MKREPENNLNFVRHDEGLEKLGQFADTPDEELVGQHVKVRLREDEKVERLWIKVTAGAQNGWLYGRIDNIPFLLGNVKLGETVLIDKREILDVFTG